MTKNRFPKRVVIEEKYLNSIKKLCQKSPKYRDPKQFIELAIIEKLKKESS